MGNFELALADEATAEVRQLFSDDVIEYMGSLSDRYEIGQVLLSHALPIIPAYDPVAYYSGPRASDLEAIQACFSEFDHRILLTGHLHQWLAATPEEILPWDGSTPIELADDQRYLFVIDAVMQGYAALLDSNRQELIPIRL